MNEPSVIREILENCKTIAVVGLSNREDRASLGVSRFMQARGYRIAPVNPRIESVLGEKSYPTLADACTAVSAIRLVNVFRAPEFVSNIVDQVIHLGIPYLWLQEGVIDPVAAARAEASGIKVVMDRCLLRERLAAGWDSQLR